MNKLVMFAGLVGGVLFVSNVEAEPRGATGWYFRTEFETGQFTESTDATESGAILMYTGSNWRCQRNAVSLNKVGLLVSGFTCRSPGGFTVINAACSPSKENTDSGSAGIGDERGWMRLHVTCVTKTAGASSSARPASIEKNL